MVGLLFFDFPSETNFTDSDTNWVFGAVNKHLWQRLCVKRFLCAKAVAFTFKRAVLCDIRRLAVEVALLYRQRICSP
jgi:hypothetical protein